MIVVYITIPVVIRHYDYLNRTDPYGIHATIVQQRWLSTLTQFIPT